MGLEKIGKDKPCFAYQLRRCQGVCIGKEKPLQHAARLLMALQKLKLASWPYPGAIGIREGEELHLVDHWCYLGTAKTDEEIDDLLTSGRPAFDRDTYMTLNKTLKKAEVVLLGKRQQNQSQPA